ncbi:MAG: SDR family NAD(P)-dependent oxidoreductase [Burkholderiales bacterium]|nr:SDR family NAD(P)-dependent oxidoreductase [Burkholderiales bacterium]
MNAVIAPHDLTGTTALVTGASSGLGRRFALTLAAAGAAVGVVARRLDRLEQLVTEIRGAGGRAAAVCLDLTRTADIDPAIDAVEAALGPVGVLVNNAGMNINKPILDVTEADYDTVMATDLRAVFFVAQAVARRLVGRGTGGRIVNIASLAAERAVQGLGVYSAAKAGVAQLTRAMALEWAARQINVNAILPGFIETELNTRLLNSPAGQKLVQSFVRRRVPDPSALDGLLLLLASPASAAITGSLFVVDDGQGFTVH